MRSVAQQPIHELRPVRAEAINDRVKTTGTETGPLTF